MKVHFFLLARLGIVILSDYSHSSGYEVDLICIFLMPSDVEHLLMCLLASHSLIFLDEMCSHVFAHFILF